MDDISNPTPEYTALAGRVAVLERDIAWQKNIHRNVGEDGNIYHKWDILPVIVAATVIGIVAGILIVKLYGNRK